MKPNIFLLTIDSVREDRFYGKKKTAVTPNFDYILKNGVYCEQNIATSDQTGTSLASIFTGKYPMNSEVTQFNFNFEFTTFFDDLKKHGYKLLSCVHDLSIFKKITKNFDENMEYIYGGTTTYPHLDNELGNKILEKFLNKNQNEPWMFFSHLLDLKDPVVWSKQFDDEKFGETAYDRNLSALDVWIGKFLEKIDLKNTLFVITADHGEYIIPELNDLEKSVRRVSEFGKKSKVLESIGKKPFSLSLKVARKIKKKKMGNLQSSDERNFHLSRASLELFDDLVKVPLLFIGYGIKKQRNISTQTRHVDIFPTIFDIINQEITDTSIDGISLMALINDQKFNEVPAYIETGSSSPKEKGKVLGIRTSEYKYFRSRNDSRKNVNLYNLKTDPCEENNLDDKIIIEKMEKILSDITNKSKTSIKKEITDEEALELEKELRKMGYI